MLASFFRSASSALLLNGVVLVAVGTQARAETPAQARAAVIVQYARESAAVSHKDLKGTLAVYAADYQQTDERGKVTSRQTTADGMRQVFQMAKRLELSTTVQKFTLKGGQGIADIKTQTAGLIVMPDKKSHSLLAIETARETWIKQGGTWRKRRSKTIRSTTTLDGKPMPNR